MHALADIEWPRLPRDWLESLMPTELPGLVREIVSAIRDEIPEYRRAWEGEYGAITERSVEEALSTFITLIAETHDQPVDYNNWFWQLGRGEAMEGRTQDALQAAYRIGAKIAWRRITALNDRSPLPPDAVARLADAVFGFVDHLAEVSARGWLDAQLAEGDAIRQLRVRLLNLLLEPHAPMSTIVDLAERVGWPIPDQAVVVDVRDGDVPAALGRVLFGPHALVDLSSPASTLLVPGPLCPEVREKLLATDVPVLLSVGCSLPLAQAPASMHWARLAARLREAGALPPERVLFCDEHLPTLMLHADPSLPQLLITRRLGPLLELSPAKRVKFGELLLAWLELGGSQAELAEMLGKHRQTLHYQFTRLRELFGEDLHDREARTEILLALRAALPAWRSAGAGVTEIGKSAVSVAGAVRA
jgi:hypothetical protein